eukprot:CAMPEP_0181492044 /NCGR_PEP_ID=MMETSP1110-20121109/50465_1 /TAXON_ID=174948 /ORGANISM="Symbiodinium sp., Strain CCMP421" /LENGTH=217 /DNA_ID=CAMNT_0023619237 /DNA_START=387 /DNA_END=1042 /DNA_ORIENTATION=-
MHKAEAAVVMEDFLASPRDPDSFAWPPSSTLTAAAGFGFRACFCFAFFLPHLLCFCESVVAKPDDVSAVSSIRQAPDAQFQPGSAPERLLGQLAVCGCCEAALHNVLELLQCVALEENGRTNALPSGATGLDKQVHMVRDHDDRQGWGLAMPREVTQNLQGCVACIPLLHQLIYLVNDQDGRFAKARKLEAAEATRLDSGLRELKVDCFFPVAKLQA